MRKVFLIARREYRANVRTKGFILGVVLAPVLMAGSGIAFALLKDRVDTVDKTVAILDRSGLVADALTDAAAQRNATALAACTPSSKSHRECSTPARIPATRASPTTPRTRRWTRFAAGFRTPSTPSSAGAGPRMPASTTS